MEWWVRVVEVQVVRVELADLVLAVGSWLAVCQQNLHGRMLLRKVIVIA